MKNSYRLFHSLGIIIVLSYFYFITPAIADTTYVSGTIVNQTWTPSGSPYIMTGDIFVAGLTINSGVRVLAGGNYQFEIAGVINAIGTQQSQIIFTTKDNHQITFAIGSDKQFKHLCEILNLDLFSHAEFENNQLRVANRTDLFSQLNNRIQTENFNKLFSECIKYDVPIGKIRNLKEVFELPEAKAMLHSFSNIQSVQSIGFKVEE